MGAMASEITSIMIVYPTVYSSADERKISELRVTELCAGNSPVTGELPARMSSNTEYVSIWWRHHGYDFSVVIENHSYFTANISNFTYVDVSALSEN